MSRSRKKGKDMWRCWGEGRMLLVFVRVLFWVDFESEARMLMRLFERIVESNEPAYSMLCLIDI